MKIDFGTELMPPNVCARMRDKTNVSVACFPLVLFYGALSNKCPNPFSFMLQIIANHDGRAEKCTKSCDWKIPLINHEV